MNDFWNKVLPGSVKTDHGKFNGTDLMIVVITLILFGFTCFRSFRFLQDTFAGTDTTGIFTIMSIVGLVGLDIATIAWAIVWMFGSTTKWQDITAITMFIISIIGMVLTSMTDTLRGENSVPEVLQIAAFYGVPAIILANVVAAILYHMISPQVSLQRKERRMQANIRETQQLGELAQKDTAMKLDLAEKQAKQNDELIARQQRLAEQNITLSGIQLGIQTTLSDTELVKQRGAQVGDDIRNKVLPPPAPQAVLTATAPALPPQPSAPEPELVPQMFLVHLSNDGTINSWRVRNNEPKEGVFWDNAYQMYAVLVHAADGIEAGKHAQKMLQESQSQAPKA